MDELPGMWEESDFLGGMDEPCQPIGCDNGYHLPGCTLVNDAPRALRRALDELRTFADDMASWCSPHETAPMYANRLRAKLDEIEASNGR